MVKNAGGRDPGLGVMQRSDKIRLSRDGVKKAARRSVPRKTKTNRVRPRRGSYFPCFAYQSALIGVKLFHFSGRSSSAKIAVTGQTSTQAVSFVPMHGSAIT